MCVAFCVGVAACSSSGSPKPGAATTSTTTGALSTSASSASTIASGSTASSATTVEPSGASSTVANGTSTAAASTGPASTAATTGGGALAALDRSAIDTFEANVGSAAKLRLDRSAAVLTTADWLQEIPGLDASFNASPGLIGWVVHQGNGCIELGLDTASFTPKFGQIQNCGGRIRLRALQDDPTGLLSEADAARLRHRSVEILLDTVRERLSTQVLAHGATLSASSDVAAIVPGLAVVDGTQASDSGATISVHLGGRISAAQSGSLALASLDSSKTCQWLKSVVGPSSTKSYGSGAPCTGTAADTGASGADWPA